jgi:hypothetical protein
MGATPHRLAKEASLRNLWGLSFKATIKSVVALSVPMPGNETKTPGPLAPPADRGARLARRSLPREGLVAAGHRAEREPGSRGHVTSSPLRVT